MGKKTPKAPDPAQTIAAQSAANKEAITESARVNAVDQYGPGGSTTYQRGADGVPTSQTVSLTPTGQDTYNRQEQIGNQLTQKAGELANRIPTGPIDVSNLPNRVTSLDPQPNMQRINAAGANPSSLGLTTNVAVPELQRTVASRANEVTNLGSQDYSTATKTAQDATFGKAQALLKPGQDLERQRLEQSLSDRGIPLDSAAGRAEMTRMAQSQSEATNRAAFDAVAAGSAEQSRLFGLDATRTQINNTAAGQRFGQDLQSGQFANDASGQLFGMNMANAQLNNAARGQAFGQTQSAAGFNNSQSQQEFNNRLTNANFQNDQRSSSLQEQLALRNQYFNEASALLQGAPVMGTPQFQNNPTYSMAPVDVAGITQQSYQNQVNAANQRNSQIGSTIFGLGNAAMTFFSDRRLKRVVASLGTGWRGLPLYAYRYVWGGPVQVGVMAQDVARVLPEAVHDMGLFLAVDYGKLREAA